MSLWNYFNKSVVIIEMKTCKVYNNSNDSSVMSNNIAGDRTMVDSTDSLFLYCE